MQQCIVPLQDTGLTTRTLITHHAPEQFTLCTLLITTLLACKIVSARVQLYIKNNKHKYYQIKRVEIELEGHLSPNKSN